jgi:hypothetical protein
VGLSGREVVAVAEHLSRLGATWDERTFHLDAEGIDVTVAGAPRERTSAGPNPA